MLESSMQESITGVIDLSSQYSLEAFCEFMAYIYYNKRYSGSYLRLLFEVLCIADYYDVNAYSTYIDDRIIKLITDVPMCLMIATEARKHGALASNIYSRCLEFLLEALKPRKAVCYDVNSGDSKAWCCASHSEKCKRHVDPKDSTPYTVRGQVACVYNTLRNLVPADFSFTHRCCTHGLVASAFTPALITINQRPDVIVDDLISAEMKEKEQENKTSSLITSSQ
ncbi:hypothetical protein BGZ75_010447 [Mortierella antarctica]|nr:hypothetical protein BGZ75_010447 [Mortierella antarctica]